MIEMNRREFVGAVAGACAACVCCNPSVWAADEKPAPIDAGELSAFAKDGIYDQFAENHKIFLIRDKKRLYAAAATCTHKAYALEIDPDDKSQLKCPKHGSVFKLDGTVGKSPAKKPLSRFAITLNDQKHVIIDKTKVFEEKDWKDPGSFLKV